MTFECEALTFGPFIVVAPPAIVSALTQAVVGSNETISSTRDPSTNPPKTTNVPGPASLKAWSSLGLMSQFC